MCFYDISTTQASSRCKGGYEDSLPGLESHLKLYQAITLNGDMIYDATMAVSRAVIVLSQRGSPARDEIMLYHLDRAMTALREMLACPTPQNDRALILIIEKMMSVAVSLENPWGKIHLTKSA